ncbi:MAG TPA: MASE3 domain-containing protein, partial [Spirochaetia bacterium]
MGTTAATPCTLYPPARIARDAALAVATMLGLWLSAQYSYLLFHSIAEIFSIIVAGAIYMVSWSSRDYPEAKPFLLLGIGYLFVAFLDVGHVLSYRGMGVLPNSTDDATRLWVAARGLQALFTLAFVLLARKGHRTPPLAVFLVGGALTLFAFLSIFLWNIFPLCLVEGVGLTPFKKISEYVICAVFLLSGILIWRDTDAVTLRERRLLSISFGLMIAAELLFTMYVSAYGLANLVGHFLKIAAFYFAYQALFASKIESRLALIEQLTRTTTQLESSRADLEKANLSKDKFFSIIAHDLRNPIGGLVTISELLSTRFDDLGAARVRDLAR